VITTDANGAFSVYATDLDGDGDADVLSASEYDDKIAWYENLGGGAFGAGQEITTDASGAYSVYATDLDGDGDADVLSGSWLDNKIAWYENLGGGTFGPQQVITTAADGVLSVYATDLDGDGDADVLSASSTDDKVAWYENLGGGAFGAQQVITTAADYARSVYATDLDGDGYADVLSASKNDDKIAWYKNLQGSVGIFCSPANAHSGGGFATLAASTHSISAGVAFHMTANNGPTLQFGYLLVSAGFVDPGVSVSDGRLCLTAPVGRYSPNAGGSLNSIGAFDVSGVFQNLSGTSATGSGFDVPFTLPNPPGGMINPGATWNFQLWYRDGAASNFSDGISVTF
jgi:hypothetical protein